MYVFRAQWLHEMREREVLESFLSPTVTPMHSNNNQPISTDSKQANRQTTETNKQTNKQTLTCKQQPQSTTTQNHTNRSSSPARLQRQTTSSTNECD
jgi:hypothetical protein